MTHPEIDGVSQRPPADAVGCGRGTRVWIVGDSHVGAIAGALKSGDCSKGRFEFVVGRLKKKKNGVVHGEIDFDQFVSEVKTISESDVIVSVIGGNHHHTIALAQHPIPFCLSGPEGDADLRPERILVPRALARDALQDLQEYEIDRIRRLVAASKRKVFHVLSPPPQRNEEDITRTRTNGVLIRLMRDNGVSPAELRMAAYRLQCDILERQFNEENLAFVYPPGEALSTYGFIKREYQADDATHANMAYGALILRKVVAMLSEAEPPPERGNSMEARIGMSVAERRSAMIDARAGRGHGAVDRFSPE